MTFEEAAAQLAIEDPRSLGRDELKRAYLRAVKRAKPEVDPEGFQRVREAFELLQRALAMHAAMDAAEAPEPPEASPPATSVPASSAPAEAPAPSAPPAHDHLAPYHQRLAVLFPGPERLQIAREAYRAFPGDPAARELLLGELTVYDRPEIVAVLTEGVRAGDQSCLYRLLTFAPGSVPEEALEILERGGPPPQRLLAAHARVARRDAARGLALFEEALTAAGLPEAATVTVAVRVILAFHRICDVERAHAAFAAFRRYLGGPGLPGDVATQEATTLFVVAHELDGVTDLPPELRAELAGGALDDDFSGVRGAVVLAERIHGEAELGILTARLRWQAPTLEALVTRARVVPMPVPSVRPRVLPGALLVFLLFIGTRLLMCAMDRSRTSAPPIALYPKVPVVTGARTGDLVQFELELGRHCREPRNVRLCANLPRLLRAAIAQNHCSPLMMELGTIGQEATAGTPEAQAFVRRLLGQILMSCRL